MSTNTETLINEEVQITAPKMYKVILHNDNVTTFDFVIAVLMQLFHKTIDESLDLAAHIHNNGQGTAGIYTYEIAEQKVYDTHSFAEQEGFPLKATVEEE